MEPHRRRWLATALDQAEQTELAMPWTRGLHRKDHVAARRRREEAAKQAARGTATRPRP